MVKLSTSVLFSLYDYYYNHRPIDSHNAELLHNAGLIVFDDKGKMLVTTKGYDLIESDFYIAPEAKSNTTTLSFDNLIKEVGTNKKLMTDLGYTLINHNSFKRWSKDVNYEFAKELESTLDYYTSKDHPTTRISKYKAAVINSTNKLERAIKAEFDKITDFVLSKKMYLETNKNGDKVYLLEVINKNLYRVQIGNNRELASVELPSDELHIVANQKEEIVRLYYTHKSTNKNG